MRFVEVFAEFVFARERFATKLAEVCLANVLGAPVPFRVVQPTSAFAAQRACETAIVAFLEHGNLRRLLGGRLLKGKLLDRNLFEGKLFKGKLVDGRRYMQWAYCR